MDIRKALIRAAFAILLSLTANVAWAVPISLTLDIDTDVFGYAGAGGVWDLSGPTSVGDFWIGDYFTTFDIQPGNYTFGIFGIQGGLGGGVTTWTLTIAGKTVAGSSNGFLGFNVFKQHVAFATSVPEPATLWLLGLGVLALGLTRYSLRSSR